MTSLYEMEHGVIPTPSRTRQSQPEEEEREVTTNDEREATTDETTPASRMEDLMLDPAMIAQLLQAASARTGGPPPASQTAIQDLDEITVDPKLASKKQLCPVCVEELRLHQDVRKMPCKHIFHEDCLLSWLTKHNTCPMCRHELDTLDLDYEELKREKMESATMDQESSSRNNKKSTSYESIYS
mmetsp:Transcript_28973/g.46861  ORF Transcript_28973/g.46861 Transcript_28973/m.46861 type:complete len:185 (+) Transcript_28973:785-1339(+)|eukprot:CAMPEP_0184645048 /NCGR_PEP_ID=MMETSP0308-20130426/1610_1 /TAXON_ID=38269 /ORGANISM="Gloeochaete witrockiana, Strain SAG 46.84" /LENGTH=184 /DNA_ID=CAMNT_0027073843 /DNA_START=1452 /DNA_END=2006 /DNA_ORIENTATION=-